MKCSKCKSEIDSSSKFCGQCGEEVDGVMDAIERLVDQNKKLYYLVGYLNGLSSYTKDDEDFREVLNKINDEFGHREEIKRIHKFWLEHAEKKIKTIRPKRKGFSNSS